MLKNIFSVCPSLLSRDLIIGIHKVLTHKNASKTYHYAGSSLAVVSENFMRISSLLRHVFGFGAYSRTPSPDTRLAFLHAKLQIQNEPIFFATVSHFLELGNEFNYSACRRRGGVLKCPRFCFFF